MGFNHNIKSPCFNCANRAVGCHGSCESYIAYKSQCAVVNKSRIEQHSEASDLYACRSFYKKHT